MCLSRPDIYFKDGKFPVADYFTIDWVNTSSLENSASYKEETY